MQIEISTKTTTIVNVENPSFFRQHGIYTAITDQFVITTSDSCNFTSLIPVSDKQRYADAIADAIKYSPTSIKKEEFEKVFNNSIKCLTEQYQLSIAMNKFDPKEGQPAEDPKQAPDEQAAQADEKKESAEVKGEGDLVD